MFEMTFHPSRSHLRGRPGLFCESGPAMWTIFFSPLVQKLWPLLAYSSLSMTHGAWAGALLMFWHLSAPSRAARQKVSTAEHWKAASPNWEPNTPTRSSRCTTWPISCTTRASWRRQGRGLWGAERWPSWHCREEGISHVARTRRVSFLFPVSPEQFGNVNWCLGWCTDRFWFEFDGEAFLATGNCLKLSVGQHCCWWIYCEIIELTTKDRGQASQKAFFHLGLNL